MVNSLNTDYHNYIVAVDPKLATICHSNAESVEAIATAILEQYGNTLRYRFEHGSIKERAIKRVFDQQFQTNADKIIEAAIRLDPTLKNELSTFPKFLEGLAVLFKHPLFKILLAAGVGYGCYKLLSFIALRIHHLCSESIFPFALKHIPIENNVIIKSIDATLTALQQNFLTFLLVDFSVRLNNVVPGAIMDVIWSIIYIFDAKTYGVILHSVYKVIKEIPSVCDSVGDYFQKWAMEENLKYILTMKAHCKALLNTSMNEVMLRA